MALGLSDRHKNRKDEMLKELTAVVAAYKDQFGDLAELDSNPINPELLVPRLFRVLGGPKTKGKITTVSNLIWLWAKNCRNTKAKEGECP